nr:DUF1697 domain-containing protein [Luteimicrobium subarcticum]
MRWVALLRGVNVGGVTVRSADLRACVEGLGLDDVRTVLATGNVLFSAPGGHGAARRRELKALVEEGLRTTFGYDAWIVLVTRDELATVVDDFPFAGRDGWHDYVTFVSEDAVLAELSDAVADLGLDDATAPLSVGEGVVRWQVEKGGTLDAPFSKLSSKARYRATTTTRNLQTLRKLLA